MKSVRRKLGIGQGRMYASKDKQGNVIGDFDDIVKAAEEFYTDLVQYTPGSHATFIRNSVDEDNEAPSISSDEVRKALQDITRGKVPGEAGLTVDFIKEAGDTREKLAALYAIFLTTSSVPESWKNANIILIHKQEDVNEVNNYRLINLRSVLYKIFIKTMSDIIRTTLDSTKKTVWLQEGLGVRIKCEYLDNLRFADDIVLFSNTGDE